MPRNRFPLFTFLDDRIISQKLRFVAPFFSQPHDFVEAQGTSFHFPQAENSTCALASPLPTKAFRLCGVPFFRIPYEKAPSDEGAVKNL